MSSLIQINSRYVTDTSELSGSVWTVGDSVYLTTETMEATNNVANGISDIGTAGVIGEVTEAPDLTETADRMVVQLTADEDLWDGIKNCLRSRDL